MSDIFVSYAKEDRPRAKTFAHALEAGGWSVFWDRVIPTGKTWREVLETQLNEAKCIVVLWSKSSVNSHWVLEEAEIALKRGILIPVLIEDVSPPLGFRSLQVADLSKWDDSASATNFKNLTRDIEAIIGSPSIAEQDQEDAEVERKKKVEEKIGSLAEVKKRKKHKSDVHPGSFPAKPEPPPSASSEKRSKTILNWAPLLLWLSIAAYLGFAILLLLEDSVQDRQFGFMFLINGVILIIGSAVSFFGKVRASKICGLGALIQVVIMVVMLGIFENPGDLVVPINLVIVGIFIGLMVLYIKIERKKSQF